MALIIYIYDKIWMKRKRESINFKTAMGNTCSWRYKKYEFRSWKTKYRGKILIHAGSGIDKKELNKYKNLGYEFPKSKIIACVDLTDCL